MVCRFCKTSTETNLARAGVRETEWWPMSSGDNRGPDHAGAQREGEEPACGHAGRPHLGPSIHTPDPPLASPSPGPRRKAKAQPYMESTVTSLSLSAIPADLKILEMKRGPCHLERRRLINALLHPILAGTCSSWGQATVPPAHGVSAQGIWRLFGGRKQELPSAPQTKSSFSL